MALTQALAELVDTIGLRATITLCRVYGARALYVPQEPPDEHPITLRIGREAADHLARLYGGTHLFVPPEYTLLTDLREREIVRRIVDQHASICDTAYAFGVSRRWVHRLLDRAGHDRLARQQMARRRPRYVDPRQLDLWAEPADNDNALASASALSGDSHR